MEWHQQQAVTTWKKEIEVHPVKWAQQILNIVSSAIHFMDLCDYACVTWHFHIIATKKLKNDFELLNHHALLAFESQGICVGCTKLYKYQRAYFSSPELEMNTKIKFFYEPRQMFVLLFVEKTLWTNEHYSWPALFIAQIYDVGWDNKITNGKHKLNALCVT